MVITSHQILITFLLHVAFSIILLAFSNVVKHCFCVNSVKITGLVQNMSLFYLLCTVPDASLHYLEVECGLWR